MSFYHFNKVHMNNKITPSSTILSTAFVSALERDGIKRTGELTAYISSATFAFVIH